MTILHSTAKRWRSVEKQMNRYELATFFFTTSKNKRCRKLNHIGKHKQIANKKNIESL
jgi:hypothetical protein